MLLASLIYLALCRLLELCSLRRRSPEFKELEIVVLRHQLDVLRRQAGRPQLRRQDRAFLAAASLWGAKTRSCVGGGRFDRCGPVVSLALSRMGGAWCWRRSCT